MRGTPATGEATVLRCRRVGLRVAGVRGCYVRGRRICGVRFGSSCFMLRVLGFGFEV